MCTDADHARNEESELLSLLREQVRVSERLLRESRETNRILMELVSAMAEEGSNEEPTTHTYIDGKPIRY